MTSLPLSAFTSPIPEADDNDNVTSTLPFPRNSFKEDAVTPSILPRGGIAPRIQSIEYYHITTLIQHYITGDSRYVRIRCG